MRPVSDGEIQAFLDGAYEALDEGRLDHIRQLIEDDPVFADSVARARSLGDRAGALLTLVVPSDGDPPSLSTLKKRARVESSVGMESAGSKNGFFGLGISRGQGVAWAATIIIALGVGWTSGRRGISSPTARTTTSPAVTSGSTLGSTPGRADADVSEPRMVQAEEESVPNALRLSDPSVSAAVPAWEVGGDEVGGDEGWGAKGTLFIPGLRVLSVGWDETPVFSGLRVDQMLPSGDTIHLQFVGLLGGSAASPPPLKGARTRAALQAPTDSRLSRQIRQAALPGGWNQVTIERGGRVIIARAKLSEMEIRAFLMRLP